MSPSLLDQTISGMHLEPLAMVVYGVAGIGKTRFASEAPKPYFLPTEKGFGKLTAARAPRIVDWRELLAYVRALREDKHDRRTVIIDTADRLEKLLWAHVAKEQGAESIVHVNANFNRGYELALVHWQKLRDDLDLLREERGMNVILLAHSAIRKFDSPDPKVPSFEFHRLDLHEKAATMWADWADVILFMNYKILTKKTEGKTVKGINADERFIYTEYRPSHWGKNRFSLPYELPFYEGQGWSAFEQAMKDGIAKP